ncbi:MAG: M20/M25/M40 family metallo-hydrolase [Gemmatimonadetes bacterium]|nr:M20/M25/M40 family metallo-hydrolase [Gemmatimonadota bacterium]
MWKMHAGPAEGRYRRTVAPATTLAFVALMAALTLAGCGSSDGPTGDDTPDLPETPLLADPPPDGAAAVATITAADLTTRVGIIADDSMMGRWTPSPELLKAGGYLAAEMDRLGLQPGGTDEQAECVVRDIAEGLCPYLQWFFAAPEDTVRSINVIGRLPGSDPVLRNEYLVIGAHFDHVGIRTPVAGDSIYNGADDNGSGTASVLELAEAFADLNVAPRRSVLFVFFSGEERGLLGSRYYAGSQEAPIGDVITMINLDMVGRNWTDTVAAIYQLDSDIFERADRVADAHPELNMNLLIDPWPGENLVNRSDQAPFIPYGVPVLFLTSGLHEDYHQASDEADRLDYEKTARLARLVFWIGWEFAEAAEPPGFFP